VCERRIYNVDRPRLNAERDPKLVKATQSVIPEAQLTSSGGGVAKFVTPTGSVRAWFGRVAEDAPVIETDRTDEQDLQSQPSAPLADEANAEAVADEAAQQTLF
jgi:hypothetical protein